jgi:8-amino-7-oxononanoate synthase
MNEKNISFPIDKFLQEALLKRRQVGSFRYLHHPDQERDFSSNDYLGLSRSVEVRDRIQTVSLNHNINIGSTGSRLLGGNSPFAEALEDQLAQFHRGEAALLYNSGYSANVGFFQCVPDRHSTILYDELIHASVRDGIRMSPAKSWGFRHNDLDHLHTIAQRASGTIFVAVEALYSMDGDTAPLVDLADYCSKHGFHLIVDEAHSNGVYGSSGEGLCVQLGVDQAVYSRLYTFGKALGSHGAVWVGSKLLRDFLINFSRAFTYTTALAPHALISIREAYKYLQENTNLIEQLLERVNFFREQATLYPDLHLLPSTSPIQGLLVPGNKAVIAKAEQLRREGFEIRPILAPTVPQGKERLRISLHTYNTREEIQTLLSLAGS